jgi:osmotically-inducible protein OsmY
MHSINSVVPARAVANAAEDGLSTIVADLSKKKTITNARDWHVKAMDHVVYLSGTVETGLHRDIAASVIREVNGVSCVVNNMAFDK